MKKTITFLATVAFSCCGITSSFAQIQIGSAPPMRSALLVANQPDAAEASPALVQDPIPNPFDFFATPDGNKSTNEAEIDSSPSDADPASLPVGRQDRSRSVIETVIDHDTVSAIPNAAMAPVSWNGYAQTPNPVAEILLRQECNSAALWSGYPDQRAAECAKMWNNIYNHHHCNGCAQPAGNCAAGNCGAGNGGCQPVRNRYLPQASMPACDQGAPSAPCSQCSVYDPRTLVPHTATRQESERNKVAFIPLPAMR